MKGSKVEREVTIKLMSLPCVTDDQSHGHSVCLEEGILRLSVIYHLAFLTSASQSIV